MSFRGSPQIYVSVCSGIVFLLASIFVMQNGHLHEDSYILFQYSRNLANGAGIAFDQLSGHSEGATDFLWMLALSFIHWASGKYIYIGVAAAAINAVGMSVLSYMILRLRKEVDLFGILLVGVLLVSGGAAASVGGFSALAFGGLYAVLVCCCLERRILASALLATTLTLFRPDGLLLIIGTLIALVVCQEREERKQTVTYVLAACVVPLSLYFVWRLSYFEMMLPLPLLVKQKTDSLFEGLLPNLSSLKAYFPILLCLTFVIRKIDRRHLLIMAGGSTLLFIALIFAHQSQNLGFRFQFPAHVSIVLLTAYGVPKLSKNGLYACLLPLLSIMLLIIPSSKDVTELIKFNFTSSFPQILKKTVELDSIAVTEAGRFPYWYDAPSMTDLIGLNSKGVALYGPKHELEAKSPDLIYIHHAGRYSFDQALLDSNAPFFVVDIDKIQLSDYRGKNPVHVAPEIVLDYAREHNYTCIAVKNGEADKRYELVYFIPPTVHLDPVLRALNESFYTKTSYFSTVRDSK